MPPVESAHYNGERCRSKAEWSKAQARCVSCEKSWIGLSPAAWPRWKAGYVSILGGLGDDVGNQFILNLHDLLFQAKLLPFQTAQH